MIQVIEEDRQEGEERKVICFDISKICEAIMKAFESVEKIIEEAMENIKNALGTFAHVLAHWFLHAYHLATGRIRAALRYNPFYALYMEAVIRIKIKLHSCSYLEIAHAHQRENLIRIQDRGTDENSDSDIYSIPTSTFTYAIAA